MDVSKRFSVGVTLFETIMDAYHDWCTQVAEELEEPLGELGFMYQRAGFDRGDFDTFPIIYGARFEAEDNRSISVYLTVQACLTIRATVEADDLVIAQLSYRDDQNIAHVSRTIARSIEKCIRKAEEVGPT